MIDTLGTVENNSEIAPGYRLLTLRLDRDLVVSPGQFAMLRPHGLFEPLLRRAFAFYRQNGPREVSFLYQVLGRGTQAMAGLARGQHIEALLPLGNNWHLPEEGGAVVVSGGIGSASLLMLCDALKRSGVDTRIYFGAASAEVARGCGLRDFELLELPLTITTDDGSLGERGFVTQPLERYLDTNRAPSTVYACGPWAMMKRAAEITNRSNVRTFVSLEAPMGCGFGVCVGCVVAMRVDGPAGYESYKRVCIDGSIFPAPAIRWEVNAMSH